MSDQIVQTDFSELEQRILGQMADLRLEHIVKLFLDKSDPKSVQIAVKRGFQLKIDEMKKQHKDFVYETFLRQDILADEKFRLVDNSDGKIRSMIWFLECIAGK